MKKPIITTKLGEVPGAARLFAQAIIPQPIAAIAKLISGWISKLARTMAKAKKKTLLPFEMFAAVSLNAYPTVRMAKNI
jgi:hypothetical protein